MPGVREAQAERARELGLAGHDSPQLLAGGPRPPGEGLLGEPALDAQQLDPLPQQAQLWGPVDEDGLRFEHVRFN